MVTTALLTLLLLGQSGPRTHARGWIEPTAAEYAQSPTIKVRKTRDTTPRPRRVILDDYLPPVGDQMQQGSCVAWSTGYYAYTYAVAKQRGLEKKDLQSAKWQFSPTFLYHQRGRTQPGTNFAKVLSILQEKGCASLAEMPYVNQDDDEKNAANNTVPSEAAFKRGAKFKALLAGCIFHNSKDFDADKLKKFLAEMRQPIVLGIPVFDDFQNAKPDVVYSHVRQPSDEYPGHAICIIGYDDDKKAFRMVNSWGKDWGDKGQLWLSEEWLAKEARDGWVFVAGGGWARSKPGEGTRPGEDWKQVLEIVPPVAKKGGK